MEEDDLAAALACGTAFEEGQAPKAQQLLQKLPSERANGVSLLRPPCLSLACLLHSAGRLLETQAHQ